MQVLPDASAKSLLAMPVVNTPMLPTLVFAAIVNDSETAALLAPTACKPIFTLFTFGLVPLKVTCACAATGKSAQAKARRKRLSIRRNRGVR
jgi:hypothetical protein